MNPQENTTEAELIFLNTIMEQTFDTIGCINLSTGEYTNYVSSTQSKKKQIPLAYDVFQKQLLCAVIPEERCHTAKKLALPYIKQQLCHKTIYQFVTMTTAVNQAPSHIQITFLYLDKTRQSILMLQKHDEMLEHLFLAQQSVERYRLIIDEMKAAVFEWNWKTGSTYTSDSCKSYLLCHEKISDILENRANPETVHPDDMAKLAVFFEIPNLERNGQKPHSA